MKLSLLDNALWAAGLIGHVALLFILVVRQWVGKFPVFTAFVASEILRTVLLYVTYQYGSKHDYYLVYWVAASANYLFQVALILEIGANVLRPTGRWVLEAGKSFLFIGAGCLVAAALAAFEMGPPQAKGLSLWDARVNVFTSLMTCGLFLAMATAANQLGLRWRNQVFAIGQGLFLWACTALLDDLGHTLFGWQVEFNVFDHILGVVYLAVLVYWGVTFWLPEKQRAPLSPEIRSYLVATYNRLDYDSSRTGRPNL